MSPPKHSVHLARLLDATVAYIRDYVVMTSAQADTSALWTAHTHALDAFETTPFYGATSPEKRCGKSRLFDTLELVAAHPWRTIMPSEAVLYRKISTPPPPTLFLDEIDAVFNGSKDTEPLRALLNAGNRRGTVVPRCVGPQQQLVDFNVFCAKAFAGIGDLPDTIADRSIIIRLARKRSDEHAHRFRRREAIEIADPISQELASWSVNAIADLELARPEIPTGLDDRAEESWEPLLAIAELAGGDWPARARRAAVELSVGRADDEALGVWLLRDVRDVFVGKGVDRLSSAELADSLNEIETSPWGDIRGRALDGRALARRLKPFSIRPRTVRFDDTTRANGYLLEQFDDAFARYLGEFERDKATRAPLSGKQAESEGGTAGSEVGRKPAPEQGSHVVAPKSQDVTGHGVPLPGDEGFDEHLLRVVRAGVITEMEALERYDVHRAIVQARVP